VTGRQRSSLRRLLAGCLVGLVVAGCLPTSVTDQGRVVNDLWNVFLVPAIVVAAIVWGLITIAILRFRRRASTPSEPPPQIAGHTGLEVVWTVIPIAIVAVLFFLTVGAVNRIYGRTDGGIDVNVTAFRWQWQIDYPADGVSVVGLPDVPAEMVVPVGEPVHVTLTSPDVIHSFYVPVFLFKRDAIPGRPNTFEFTVEEEGTYRGQCAEFCGVNHDRMTFAVKAVQRADYETWLAAQRAGAGATPGPTP
jgi:cytochrome c oxidase subunit II